MDSQSRTSFPCKYQHLGQALLQVESHPNTISSKFSQVKESYKYPYWAIGEIKTNLTKGMPIRGTGVLISPKHVLTVAKNIYNHSHDTKAVQTFFYPEVWENGQKIQIQIPVTTIYFYKKYITSSKSDQKFFDIAILELAQNSYIKQNQFLQISTNWKHFNQQVLIAGYPNKQNFKQRKQHADDYQAKMFENSNKIIAGYKNFLQYSHQADEGLSGAPILVLDGKQYKIIGLHQTHHQETDNILGILISDQLQNSFTILKDLMKEAGSKNFTKIHHDGNKVIADYQSQIQEFKKRQKNYIQTIEQQEITIKMMQQQSSQLKKLCNYQTDLQKPIINQKIGKIVKVQIGEGLNKQLKLFSNQETKVDLSYTCITGIQVEILLSKLLQLQQLDLHYCHQLRNVKLEGCNKLKKLNISSTQITDTQMEELSLLPSLQQLDLSYCKQIQNIKLTNCSKLKKLDCSSTKISDAQLEHLSQLPELEQLYLHNCQQLQNIKLPNFKKLKKLDLSFTSITDTQLEQLNQLLELEQLNLRQCQQLQNIRIPNCNKLKKLDLGLTKIIDTQLQQLSQLPQLEQLILYSCLQLKEIKLSNCKKLKRLNLRSTKITDKQLELLSQLPQLEQLTLIDCQQLQNMNLQNFKMIRKVDLSCTTITDAQLQKLSQLSQLRQLALIDCQQLHNINLLNCNNLQKLDLSETNISQQVKIQLRKLFPNTQIKY